MQILREGPYIKIPALVDPHVHFRTPGAEHKENWVTAANAALKGGVTTVLDMPNNTPSCCTLERLRAKKALIDSQLQGKLHYGLYLGAHQDHLDEIIKAKDEACGLKIYMGSSTGDLLMTDEAALVKAFENAAAVDMIVAVHAEDECLIHERMHLKKGPETHSIVRNPEVARRAVEKAINLVAKTNARLYIAHVSTKEELDLIRQAKKNHLPVFAEATPHHLFLTTELYKTMGSFALVNPPLRDTTDALWDAIYDGTIDTIGTDHAPHLPAEKTGPKAMSGFPSIELYLALLLDAYNKKRITLETIVRLTSANPRAIFRLPACGDLVLVDLELIAEVTDHLETRSRWSPYRHQVLQGWPVQVRKSEQQVSELAYSRET